MAIENLSDLSAMRGRFFCGKKVSNTFITFMVNAISYEENILPFCCFGAFNA